MDRSCCHPFGSLELIASNCGHFVDATLIHCRDCDQYLAGGFSHYSDDQDFPYLEIDKKWAASDDGFATYDKKAKELTKRNVPWAEIEELIPKAEKIPDPNKIFKSVAFLLFGISFALPGTIGITILIFSVCLFLISERI